MLSIHLPDDIVVGFCGGPQGRIRVESQAARGKLRGITDKSSYIKILQQEDVSGYPLVSNPPCNGGTWVGELRSQMPVR